MDQTLIADEIQALLATLKSSLSGSPGAIADMKSEGLAAPEDSQLLLDPLPDCRAIRRFLLMV